MASGSAYGMRSATSPKNVAMPMIAESSNCAESHELIRVATRISIRRRRPRTSGGAVSSSRFRSRSASMSMYAIMNSTASAEAIAVAALRM